MANFWGNEFLVNTTTASIQFDHSITALADGRFVVAWRDDSASGGDTSSAAVRAQVFNADGSKSGGELLVNTTTHADQSQPSITALADGRFVVAWADFSATGGDTSGWAIRAQIFDADGAKSGGEFLVNTTTASNQQEPSITALADGRFVVAWTDESVSGGDTSGTAVRAQIFEADGAKSGGEFLVNTTTASNQRESSITALADGRFVVAWRDESASGGDTSSYAVRAQIFEANGTKSGGEFLVNTATAIFQLDPSITALADGRFVVAWADYSQSAGDTSVAAIRAQVFNANGTKSGGEFVVNTTTLDDQYSPSITALADGRFVAAWTDISATGSDTSFEAVRAQVFNADGTKSGGEFLVNTTTANDQHSPSITALADGRFAVAWTGSSATGGDTSANAVRGQIFDPRSSGLTWFGSLENDQFAGTFLNDHLNGELGDDRIWGGNGQDLIEGGFGDDWLSGNHGNDKLYGGVGNDALYGDHGYDLLYGDAGNDILNGGVGKDATFGGTGNDIHYVDNQYDLVFENIGEGSNDRVAVSRGTYALAAGVEVELFTTTATASTRTVSLTGNEFSQTIIGNAGVNALRSGTGAPDLLRGLGGNDTYWIYNSGDDIIEMAGQGTFDRVVTSVAYSLAAGVDVERLQTDSTTGTANINLSGNEISQTIIGNAGLNYIRGGGEEDTLYGKLGDDRFVFYTSDFASGVNDVIKDFHEVAGDTDVLRLQGSAANYAFADIGANLQVTHIASGGTITINNFSQAQLDTAQTSYF